MKVLLFNPQIDAQHKIVKALEARDIAVLTPQNVQSAWEMLQFHGASVSLAVIHREGADGAGQPGIELIRKIKNDVLQADLPYVLTTSAWGDKECSAHQKTAGGANAYLKSPFEAKDLISLVDELFSEEASASEEAAPPSLAEISEIPTAGSNSDFAPLQVESFEAIADADRASTPGDIDLSPLLGQPEEGSGIELPADDSPFELTDHSKSASESSSSDEDAPTVFLASDLESEEQSEELSLDSSEQALETQGEYQMPEVSISEVSNDHSFDLAPERPPESIAVEAPVESMEAPVQSSHEESAEAADDDELAEKLPYLFNHHRSLGSSGTRPVPGTFEAAMGDAIVPGGAAESPDVETLKNYLRLREQDVIALSRKHHSALERLRKTEEELTGERAKNNELSYQIQEKDRQLSSFEREKRIALGGVQAEIEELRFQNRAKSDKAKLLEGQVREMQKEMERLKERVRSDIRKIRVRERELENRLEIVKKDAEALLIARENKIIELKRKLDTLEFNMDLLHDRYSREKETSAKLRDLLSKAAQAVRVADGLLDIQREFSALTAAVEAESGTDESSGISHGEKAAS